MELINELAAKISKYFIDPYFACGILSLCFGGLHITLIYLV